MLNLVIFWLSFAGAQANKPLVIDLVPQDTLALVIPDGQIRLISSPGSQASLKVTKTGGAGGDNDEDWNMVSDRRGNRVELKVRIPDSRAALTHLLKNERVPRFIIEGHVPAVHLEVAVRKGNIRVENHIGAVKLQLLVGDITILGGEGPLAVTHQEGILSVRGHRGSVRCESYQGKVFAEAIKGNLEIENFMGETSVKASEGSLNLTSSRGTSRISGQKGRMDFWQGRGTLSIDDLQGSLKGQTQQGSVVASLGGEADVRLTSQEGPISLKLKDSKALLQLSTQDGNIFVPSPLRVTDMGSQKYVRGRLSGNVGGSVVVKSDSGVIRVQ